MTMEPVLHHIDRDAATVGRKGHYLITALSSVSGVMMGLVWYGDLPGLLLLVALVPQIILAELTPYVSGGRFGNRTLFIRLLPGMLLFNTISLFWLRISGWPLMVTAIAGNSFIMAFTFWVAWLLKHKMRSARVLIPLTVLWTAMEYLTGELHILSPWLNLGNGMAAEISLIQWYEYTGIHGGTIWILLCNYLIAETILLFVKAGRGNLPGQLRAISYRLVTLLLLIITPPAISIMIDRDDSPEGIASADILIVQPNIDPWEEKFDIPFYEQMRLIASMAGNHSDSSTAWVITPETAIAELIPLSQLDDRNHFKEIYELLDLFPDLQFIGGATTVSDKPLYHNSAILFSRDSAHQVYHKSKLVPGIERRFDGISSFLQRLFPDLGGLSPGYTGQKGVTNFTDSISGVAVAPVICFESAFGGHVARFVRDRAGFIAVITNDGWWKGTRGYQQHLRYSQLRAIETRRMVARASNTGISAIIDRDGTILTYLPWMERGVISGTVTIYDDITLFVRYGNIVGRMALAVSVFLIAIYLIAIPLRDKIG